MTMYRQGDVLIVKVDKIPTDARNVERDNGRVILAYGEVTGHAHAIKDEECEMVVRNNWRTIGENDREEFIRVLREGGVDLEHEEHDTIKLPEGEYKIVHQREFDVKFGTRRVRD